MRRLTLVLALCVLSPQKHSFAQTDPDTDHPEDVKRFCSESLSKCTRAYQSLKDFQIKGVIHYTVFWRDGTETNQHCETNIHFKTSAGYRFDSHRFSLITDGNLASLRNDPFLGYFWSSHKGTGLARGLLVESLQSDNILAGIDLSVILLDLFNGRDWTLLYKQRNNDPVLKFKSTFTENGEPVDCLTLTREEHLEQQPRQSRRRYTMEPILPFVVLQPFGVAIWPYPVFVSSVEPIRPQLFVPTSLSMCINQKTQFVQRIDITYSSQNDNLCLGQKTKAKLIRLSWMSDSVAPKSSDPITFDTGSPYVLKLFNELSRLRVVTVPAR